MKSACNSNRTVDSEVEKHVKNGERNHERNEIIRSKDGQEHKCLVPDGTDEDVSNARERYYASTSVAMLLEKDPEKIKQNIRNFCCVSEDRKEAICREWQTGKMAHGAPLRACASCGIRSDKLAYDQVAVRDLSAYFEFNASNQQEFDALKEGVRFMDASGTLKPTNTDLSPIMSSFLAGNNKRYHLHPELVSKSSDDSVSETCFVCINCYALIAHENSPLEDPSIIDSESKLLAWNIRADFLRKKSRCIAAGFDFGVLSRIPLSDMAKPSAVESAVLKVNRLYIVVVKVTNANGVFGAPSAKGDMIVFLKDGPGESLRLIETISKIFE